MATALYRRYRPETFAEMIGQSQVTEPLMTALRGGKVGHAYLFSGPRGCGKTTSARVLARCLNCAEGPTDTPCGVCPSCVELSRDGGGSLDVIEIDAASHGGVDDARDLRERAVFAPVRDRYKVFIIDEAHMVTKEGFNALLKIVEEPPEHVKFVFATTEPEKVIGTIRSRTHHYPFRLIAPAALLDYVQKMCAEEGVGVDEGVLPLVIRAGGGSARDTLSILDQLIAGSEGSHIDYERAVGLLGYTPDDLLDEVVTAIGAADAAAGIQSVDRVVQTGQDPRRFVEDLLERLRDLIIVQVTDIEGAAAVLRGVPEEQLQRMVTQASQFGRGALSRVADVVSDALDSMTGATAPRMHLELMMARIFVTVSAAPEQATVTAVPVQGGKPAAAAPAPRQVPARETVPGGAAVTPPTPAADPVEPAAPVHQASPPAQQQEAPQPQAPQPTPQPSTPERPSAPVSPAEAIRNARAFLAGGQPASAPAAVPAPAPAAPEASAATSSEPEAQPQAAAPQRGDQPTVFDTNTVRARWSETVEHLRSTNPAAAATAQEVVVLGVDNTTLHLGFHDGGALEAFKQRCAAPVRAHLDELYGVSVGYQPWVGPDRINEGKQLFGASAPVAHAPASEDAPGSTSEAPEPEPDPAPSSPNDGGRAEEEPPYDEPPFEDPGESQPRAVRRGEETPVAAPAPQPEPTAPAISPAPSLTEPPASLPTQSSPAQHPREEEAPQPKEEPAPTRSAPAFTRYGESVVREVLGAKFVGEQPLA